MKRKALVLALLSCLSLAWSGSLGKEPSPPLSTPAELFHPVPLPSARPITSTPPSTTPPPPSRPREPVRQAKGVTEVRPKQTSITKSPSTHRAVGSASWYCCTKNHPSGLYAAAGPALRVGNWRGRVVWVNGIRVTLIDWCQCYGTRVIDLYPDVFRKLAPLSRGVVKVTVTW